MNSNLVDHKIYQYSFDTMRERTSCRRCRYTCRNVNNNR